MIVRPPDFGESNPYAEVDRILGPWADEHAVRVYTAYKDDEVRSFDLVGHRYQVWIPWPMRDGTVTVQIWRREDRGTITFTGAITELRTNLDLAFDLAFRRRPTGQSTRLPPPRWVRLLLRWLRLDKPSHTDT